MSKARFYIYRNLNKGKSFSVKYKGKVILVTDFPIDARDVTLKVSEKGWKRARSAKQRNVHAYAIASDFNIKPGLEVFNAEELWYNPFRCDTPHFRRGTGQITVGSSRIIFKDGKAWIPTK